MTSLKFERGESFARKLDQQDPLESFRKEFFIPKTKDGKEVIYLTGNSLGLQPRRASEYIQQELKDWADLGVEGHFQAKHPWLPYHENLTGAVARVVGARPLEVVVMNTLTVNLHLMMVSFYRPTKSRYKIMVERGAFPSDQYAVQSQLKFHGVDLKEGLIELTPRPGENCLRLEDVLERIKKEGESTALILIGNVNYLTGQALDMAALTEAGHSQGCLVGFDLAHGAGNLMLQLHDWNVDFAVWCSYKYMNGGPGTLAGCFVHERHAHDRNLPRFAGWWGHDKKSRFQMKPNFEPIPGAEGWQLSNPPIFQMAALRASLELFDRATMAALREKSEKLTSYLEFLLGDLPQDFCSVLTPKNPSERGCQLSFRIKKEARELVKKLGEIGVICDFREPDVLRVAPVPLYNSFEEVFRFAQVFGEVYGK